MTDDELKIKYAISDEVIEMLRDCCNVDVASGVDLIYNIANIKILQHRLKERGLSPDIHGCEKMAIRRSTNSVVLDALNSQ